MNDYSQFVRAHFKAHGYIERDKYALLHSVVGMASEVGELLDNVKGYCFHNKPFDRENLIEELGDLRFYMEALLQNLGIDAGDVKKRNIEKLYKRYPTGYSDKAAAARADKQE